eukprot:TRINITY_DN86_c0_g2_i3.p1 TRINITY_DN86_c0_g2~~TRINITY_DN86_c0_g2_i3.p1  ORF type:complete len:486 (-),score=67.17 TRINITY_DN86_c0_g2_i3:237-1694(-)
MGNACSECLNRSSSRRMSVPAASNYDATQSLLNPQFDVDEDDDDEQKEVRYVSLPHEDHRKWETWNLILSSSFPRTIPELENVFRDLHTPFGHPMKILGLSNCVLAMSEDDRQNFFQRVLPCIKNLVLQMPTLFPERLPLLAQFQTRTLDLSRHQVASLLAAAFFCLHTAPENDKRPYLDFQGLYNNGDMPHVVEKIRCILHYFDRISQDGPPTGDITLHRYVLPKHSISANSIQNLKRDPTPLAPFEFDVEGAIENCDDALQIDFANKYIGGGVLRKGCVQEEIRFCISTECLVSILFCEVMHLTESITIVGAERFCDYKGYGATLKFAGNYQDDTPRDGRNRVATAIVAIDAIVARSTNQFTSDNVWREFLKAFCGFSVEESVFERPVPDIATGNWGCGAFGGSIPLKAMIQWIAASKAQRSVIYFPYGDRDAARLQEVVKHIISRNVSVGTLFTALLNFCSHIDPSADPKGLSLYDYLVQVL